jgi:nucleoside 2-deoxyribosyltransferase
MRVYIAIKYHADNANRPKIESISNIIGQIGSETIVIARDLEQWGAVHVTPNVLMQKSFEAIEACDLVLIDLTEKGVGIGIEAGYAYAKSIPIVTIAEQGADISTTLQGISRTCFWYENDEALTTFLAQELTHAN